MLEDYSGSQHSIRQYDARFERSLGIKKRMRGKMDQGRTWETSQYIRFGGSRSQKWLRPEVLCHHNGLCFGVGEITTRVANNQHRTGRHMRTLSQPGNNAQRRECDQR